MQKKSNLLSLLAISIIFSACNLNDNSKINYSNEYSNNISNENNTSKTTKPYVASYKGLQFYYDDMPTSNYTLEQLSDSDFNALPFKKRLIVANNLLNSLFFGYKYKDLIDKINSGNFISTIKNNLSKNRIKRDELEDFISNSENFNQYTNKAWARPQVVKILTRFYAMNKLDRYYFENYIAYILTQTIMFSPAYELRTSHTPDISRVYNRIINMLDINSGMSYITYVHMMSQDNWRRFRSPEDNGREMLEIFTLDTNDSHVPLAAKALKNWRLNSDSDTLEVGLNKNTTPIELFDTIIYNGEDFYRELVKSKKFKYGVTKRLVDFYFPNKSNLAKNKIIKDILKSNPNKWQDIIKQILFSKEYLLHNNRALSAEESFFSFTKKLDFKVRKDAFAYFKNKLNEMHQAPMRYKLGRLHRVPLDSLSFATYNKFLREYIFLNYAYSNIDDKNSWKYDGWSEDFISTKNFKIYEDNPKMSLKSFINYLFNSTISRDISSDEFELFKEHMMETKDDVEVLRDEFNIIKNSSNADSDRLKRRRNVARVVMDYISRLEETYTQKGLNNE